MIRTKFEIGDRVQSVIAPEKHGIVTAIVIRAYRVLHYQVCWAEDLRDGYFHDFEIDPYAPTVAAGFSPKA